MNSVTDKWVNSGPYFLSVLRIICGLLFICFGATILFSFPAPPPTGNPPIMSQVGIGGILELVGGVLITLGLFTRLTAFILSGMMAVAYWQFHFPSGFWPTVNQGVPSLLFCFIFLYYSAVGAGKWSVDEMMSRK